MIKSSGGSDVTAVVNDDDMRQLPSLLWAPTTERVVKAVVAIGASLGLLLILAGMTVNLAEQASGTWLWMAPVGLAVGPALAISLRSGWVRKRSAGIHRVLAAGAFLGAAGLSLWAAYPDRVVGILGAMCGVGWGIWQVEQRRVLDVRKDREEDQCSVRQRHEELLREVRRNRVCQRRIEEYRRRAADGPRAIR